MLTAESMMYQPLVAFFEHRGMVVLREVVTAEGRVDVVAAGVDWEAAQERDRLGFRAALLRMPLLRAWDALPSRGPLDVEKWSDALAVSKSSVQTFARELVELGFA